MADTSEDPRHPPHRATTVDRSIACGADIQADEAMLRRAVRAGRVAILADRAISVGIGVRAGAPYLARAKAEGWPIVRRSSGGTAVAHWPGDLAWTIVLPRTDARVGRDFARGYGRLGRAVIRFLSQHRVRAEWVPSPALSESYCLLGGRGSVLTVDGRVLGGAAQHVSGTALLHHGILPRSIDRAALGRVFGLRREGETDRLTSLEEIGIRDPPTALADELGGDLEAYLSGS